MPASETSKHPQRCWERPLLSPHGYRVRRHCQVLLAIFALLTCFVIAAFLHVLTHPSAHFVIAPAPHPSTVAGSAVLAVYLAVGSAWLSIHDIKKRLRGERLWVPEMLSLYVGLQLVLVVVFYAGAFGGHWLVWYIVEGHALTAPDERFLAYVRCFGTTFIPGLWLGFVIGFVSMYRWVVRYERRQGVQLIYYDPRVSKV